MFQPLRTAALMLLTLTLLTGGVYPLVVTAIAQLMFPNQANGSIILNKEQQVGSSLIGQSFTSPRYFWSRLSATSVMPYNAAASSGSNYGPMHPALMETATARITALASAGSSGIAVPVDLITSSGSGLDPHISPAAAELQVDRVAKARQISVEDVRRLVMQHTEGRTFGVLGEPRVNVLLLNMSLDQLSDKE
jgi:potassium-transporting ATPase KdpC subunit